MVWFVSLFFEEKNELKISTVLNAAEGVWKYGFLTFSMKSTFWVFLSSTGCE